MRPKVSLILPVSCDDIILRRCVSALNSQTFTDFEIVVADNSYDGYEEALRRKLHDFDARVRIFTGDPATPRWKHWRGAVAAAAGQYIIFVHPDQWLEDDAVETLVEWIDNTGADFAEMRTVKCLNGVAVKNNNPVPDGVAVDRLISGNELRGLTRFVGNGSYISSSVNDKIYRRDLLLEVMAVDYQGGASCSDILNIHYLRHARAIVFLSYAGLNYNWQSDTGLYRYSSLEDAKHAYRMKHLFGQDEECIRAELADALRQHANGMIIDNGWTADATQHFIAEELTDPLWRQAGIDISATELVEAVDKRERWLDFTRILGRLLR